MPRVSLRIVNTQSDGVTEDTLDESYEALRIHTPEADVLHYKMNSGPDTVLCEMKIFDTRLEIRNRGAVKSCLILEPGVLSETSYSTPYGTFLLEAETEKLSIIRTGEIVKVEVRYILRSGGELMHSNRMKITIKTGRMDS